MGMTHVGMTKYLGEARVRRLHLLYVVHHAYAVLCGGIPATDKCLLVCDWLAAGDGLALKVASRTEREREREETDGKSELLSLNIN
jgi:hypothetical protein